MVTHESRSHRSRARAEDRTNGASSGALHDALNRSAAVQAQIALGEALNAPVQRQEEDEDELEQLLQMKREDEEELMPPPQLKREDDDRLTQLKADDTGLPHEVRNGIESLSGMSLDGVNVHYDSAQPAQLHALAYTQDTDIHVAPGQEQHVAHEAWHVVQQMQGRVQPTTTVSGVDVNDSHALEREADVMGARAASVGAAQAKKEGEGGR